MKKTNIKYYIHYKKVDEAEHTQVAYDKTDLFQCLREMLKDGYEIFNIRTAK